MRREIEERLDVDIGLPPGVRYALHVLREAFRVGYKTKEMREGEHGNCREGE